jgi:hypothetical protein
MVLFSMPCNELRKNYNFEYLLLFTGAALYALSSELLISNKFWD